MVLCTYCLAYIRHSLRETKLDKVDQENQVVPEASAQCETMKICEIKGQLLLLKAIWTHRKLWA